MAGPTSSILLNTIPSEQTVGEIEGVIQSISNKVDGNDFWVTDTRSINGTISGNAGRPFGIEKHVIDSDHYEYTDEEIVIIREQVGFNPTFDLGIYAMGNREIDHKILGELTLYLAEKLDGLIDFGGQLPNQAGKIKGKIWEIPYETTGGMMAVYNIADVDFMKNWLGDGKFRMIK